MHLHSGECRWRGNQVRTLSDPVTVSRERSVQIHCMSASIWEGTEKRWSPSQETCLDCIRLKLPSKVSIHTCLWDMECLRRNESFTCREPWTGFMHCIKRQGESLRLPNVLLYHGIFLRKQVSRFSACRIRAAAVRRPFFVYRKLRSNRSGRCMMLWVTS